MSANADDLPEVQSIRRVLEQLKDGFEVAPNEETLMRLIHHQWYRAGLLHEPALLLLEHADLVEHLGPKHRQLAERILGHYRLAAGSVPIPPRSSGIAYTPEPARVMYCVHSAPTYNSNGYSVRTRGVAVGTRDAGTDVVVVTRGGYPWDTVVHTERPIKKRTLHELDRIEYVHLPGPSLVAVPFDHYVMATADAFVREARIVRPSIIHAASNFRTALPALIAARRLGVPFVYEVRGFWELSEAADRPGWESTPRFNDMVELETLVATEADAVLAITSQVSDELQERGIDRAKITIAANAVDPDQFAPLPRDENYAEERSIRTDVPIIGYAGSFVAYEGLDTLLEASSLLEQRNVAHQVVLAGSGDAEVALKAKQDQLGLDSVAFIGRLPMSDMPRLISTFDIMALPRTSSRVTELVSPLKPLEAFASAKAVVFSDVAPHRDLAGDMEQRGLLFPAGDAQALADRLEVLVGDRGVRHGLGRAARRWVREERSWHQLGRTVSHVYEVATEFHHTVADEGPGLADLQVALLAGARTTTALEAAFHVTNLDCGNWRDILDSGRFDLLLVEVEAFSNSGNATTDGEQTNGVENPELLGLLEHCRDRGIPCAYWGSSDPSRFNEFRNMAARFDHVFTTEASLIRQYLQSPSSTTRSVSSLPFFIQPTVHNPLATRGPYATTAAYLSTDRGDRTTAQFDQLRSLLSVGADYGLDIYSRELECGEASGQHPIELRRYVRGYSRDNDVIRTLGTHLAQLHLDEVSGSPTAYSRRLIEVVGRGGVVLSAASRAVTEAFGGVIPATDDEATWRALLHDWKTRPGERVREAWFQMRAVYRSHTSATALTILARTMGLAVAIPTRATYALVVDGNDHKVVEAIGRQSVRPLEVFTTDGYEAAVHTLRPFGIHVRKASALATLEADWVGKLSEDVERTHYEDILLVTQFGEWSRITAVRADDDDGGRPLARVTSAPHDRSGLVAREVFGENDYDLERALTAQVVNGIELLLEPPIDSRTDKRRHSYPL